jgi:hypothetical protein
VIGGTILPPASTLEIAEDAEKSFWPRMEIRRTQMKDGARLLVKRED